MISTWSRNRVQPGAILLLLITVGLAVTSQPGSLGNASNFHKPPTSVLQPAAGTPTGSIFDHVVIIVMENEGVFNICGQSPPPCSTSGPAPYMAGLANNYTIGAQYLSLITTSQPNYVALLSGSMQGCTASGCPSPITAPNLVDRFEAVGLTWKGYFENQTLPRGCDTGSPEPYAVIHNPFVVFQDITNNTARCNKLVDANPNGCGTVIDCALVNDLNNATSTAPNFMWLTPNDCDNMRGNAVCGTSSLIGPGNTYLSRLVPTILNSRTFTTARSALFITFDEGNSFCPGPFPSSEDCVYASWSGPVAKTNFGTGNLYNHYSLPKTIETNWNLASLTVNDQNAVAMTEFFKNQPADFTIRASPGSLTSPIGARANSTLTMASINNFNGTIALSATSSPAGPSLTLNPTSITLAARGSGTSTLTFSSANTGNYTVIVKGTNSTLVHNTTITFSVAPPDFALSTTPSSLTLGQLGSTAGPSVAVNSTGDRTFFESSYLQTSFYAKGLIWLFFEDSRFICEHQSGCLTYTTSANGSRWAPTTRLSVHITDNDFSVYTNGTGVFYVRYNETSFDSKCGKNLQFGLGTLNTSGSITWQPEQTVFVGAANRAYPDDDIIVDSNGQVWIAYFIDNKSACGGSGIERPQIIHSAGINYGSWLGNTTLCVSACHSLSWRIALASLGGAQVYSLYWVNRFGIHGRLYNGTAWNAEETISTDVTDVNNWLFNSGTSIYAIYFDNITETYNFATRSSTGAWASNLIGVAETHNGALAFSSSYYALPDSASYDAKDNLFDLFYMNATTQRIDQWSGFGSSWTLTTGLVTTINVPYPNSITSLIQSGPTLVGSIFYVSGSTTFTINSASITFTPAGNTGTFKVTVTGRYGFASTVSLTTSISPTTGLIAGCSPTSIPGGSGSSTCTLTSSNKGNYTVTVSATNGTLTHSTIVRVTVIAIPDFTITAASPTALAGVATTATVTVKALNGFNSTITLTRPIPTGILCTTFTPNSLAGSGNATLTCTANSAANYTISITGSSGQLSHTISLSIQVTDFSITPSPITLVSPIGTNATSTLILTSLNGFSGTINFNATVQDPITAAGGGGIRGMIMAPPSTLPTTTLSPATIVILRGGSGQCILTIILSPGIQPGVYPLAIKAFQGGLSHYGLLTITASDFSLTSSANSLTIRAGSNSTITLSLQSIYDFRGNITLSTTVTPSGPVATLHPSMLRLTTNGNSSQLAIVIPSNTPAGNYTITVQATSGNLTHTLNVPVRVTATGFASIIAEIFGPHNAAPIAALAFFTLLSAFARLKTRTYARNKAHLHSARTLEHRSYQTSRKARVRPFSSAIPLFQINISRDEL